VFINLVEEGKSGLQLTILQSRRVVTFSAKMPIFAENPITYARKTLFDTESSW